MTTPRFGADFPLITRRICSLRRHRSILWRVSVVHDRRFRDMFNMIIGILVGIVAGIYFLAVRLGNRGQALEGLMQDPLYQSQVAERIALGVRVAVAGQDNSALAILPDPSTQQGSSPVTVPTTGAEVFQQACVACHGQGIAGAPRAGDAAAWNRRIAQGKSTLYRHAIQGFKGDAGVMPPKGGRIDVSDDLIRAAVDQMIEASQ